MKLKNEALQKLYDSLVDGPISLSVYAGVLEKPFEEVDRELTNLQNRNDVLEKSNGTLLDANFDLCTKNRDLENRIEQLEKELDEAKSSVEYFKASRNDWRSRAKHEEEEKTEQAKRADNLKHQVDKVLGERFQLKREVEQLKKDLDALLSRTHCAEDEAEDLKNKCSVREERIKELQDRNDILHHAHESDVRVIGKLHSQMVNLEDEKTEQEKRANILLQENKQLKKDLDDLLSRAHWAEDEVEELKKQLDGALEAKKSVNDSRYKWAQKWLSTKQNLETKLNEAEVKYRRLEKEHEELTIENKWLQDGLRDIGYEQGQTDLWDMLQSVKDMQPNEFDTECECLGDVIDMDLEDFLDAYKNWQEQKETDFMRKWLADFCVGRACTECPLGSHEYKCGCGYSFNRRDRFDTRIIPDEDIERYYEKANGCSQKIPVPVSARLPQPWECTIEGKFEINKDILEKVCGIKPDEEEHKFEYGDAVRLPWRDYDYMYIGPSKANPKHIRLFDPKNRHVVVVSSTDNLTYNHGGILVANEDDLRKIWKDYE